MTLQNLLNYQTIFIIMSLFLVLPSCRNKEQTNHEATPSLELPNAFEKYLSEPDSNHRYELMGIQHMEGYQFHVLRVISQAWLTEAEVEDPLWWHWVSIVIPDQIASDTAFLWIGGGNRGHEPPKEPDQVTEAVALSAQSIGIYVHNIPNQPLTFKNDDFGPRSEDELIAFGWRKYLDGGAQPEDAKWLARFPMTKAVMRAMDAATDHVQKASGRHIGGFTVAGGSKRGWTTWTTGIMDDRVVAIVPVVIDMLNVIPSFQHHWQVYGFWAPAVNDYVQEGIMDMQNTKAYETLVNLVEPYSYRQQLTLPKLIINAAGDQFFLPDSWRFYWEDLPGEKHIRYIANTDHSLKNSDAIETLANFHKSIVSRAHRPDYEWSVTEESIDLILDSEDRPDSIWLWSIHNPTARDFRLESIGAKWTSESLIADAGRQIKTDLAPPQEGWSAHFIEFGYIREGGSMLKFSTGVQVVPDSLPFTPYVPKANEN